MAANAFTSTLSPETLGDIIRTSATLLMQCMYNMQQNIDISFFIEVDLNRKLKIASNISKSKYTKKDGFIYVFPLPKNTFSPSGRLVGSPL
jgi:hypothetical protein